MSVALFIARGVLATAPPASLQTTGGTEFGDGAFQPGDMVTVHNVTNLPAGLRAKVVAFDVNKALYVVKDGKGDIWGLKREKLRAQQTLSLKNTGNWTEVPEGVTGVR